jgi:anti-sigma regulatory factor (Ser/Thr protein kinase)
MASTSVELDSRLITFVVPSSPESARTARLQVRAVLGSHGLGEYADDAEIVTSELVTNAIQHVRGTETIGVVVARVSNPSAITVIVSDSSAEAPIRRETTADSRRGRGLQIVESVSAQWGWHPEDGGKVTYAVLTRGA